MLRRLRILLSLIILVTIYPLHLHAQNDGQVLNGADILAMPDDDTKFRTLDEFIQSQTNPDTLLYYTEHQVKLAKKLDIPLFLTRALMNNAHAYGRLYDYHNAVTTYEQALKLAIENCNMKYTANCYNEMAVLLTRTNV